MNRPAHILATCCLCLCLASCGPMKQPMVTRLDEESQQKIDAAWEKALAPVDRLEHALWLDVFVGTGAYQCGVDKLTFRSEKRFSRGSIVMEIHFDRERPKEDRFEVKVLDKEGKVLRQERYGRDEVEKTYSDLFVNAPRPPREGEVETPEQAALRAKHEARWKKIEELFPREKDVVKE